MNNIDILNKWLEYIGYDPDKKVFNLFSNDYDLQKINKSLITFVNEFDNDCEYAIIFAKNIIINYFRQKQIPLIDILSTTQSFEKEREIWNIFNQNNIQDIETEIITKIFTLIEQVSKKKLIGSLDTSLRDNFNITLKYVIQNIPELKLDVYMKGSKFLPIQNMSTSIHVFNTLADCLLAIEKTIDGIYLCYISENNSLGGYFGYYIKNNGNIISLNERIDESYAGQHNNCRNGRWAEDKLYNIFPYDYIFSFSEYDYKGYASKHVIDNEKLQFFNLDPKVYIPILLTMIFINKKFIGKTFENEKIMYVDSLLPININTLNEAENTSIVSSKESGLILSHENFEIKFDKDKVLSGAYSNEFDVDNDNRSTNEKGYFKNYNQIFIDLYGHDFDFNINDIFQRTNYKQITSSDKSHPYKSEFIGSKERMEMQAYYTIRKKLTDHIKKNMEEEYINFGGKDAIHNWWHNSLIKNIDYIYKKCIEIEQSPKQELYREIKDNIFFKNNICKYIYAYKYDETSREHITHALNKRDYYGNLYCFQTEKLSTLIFVFKMFDYHDIEEYTNTELPKIFKGWRRQEVYAGNSILNAIDYVNTIRTPMSETNWRIEDKYTNYSFDFKIGFTLRGFNKIKKEFGS